MTEFSLWPSRHSRRQDRLDTEISECGTFTMVTVRGRLTLDTSPALLDAFRHVLRQAPKMKVNLREVDFLDSSGISVLIQGLKLAQEKSVDYVLLDPSPKVRAVIELSQLQTFFEIETSSNTETPCDLSPGNLPSDVV